MIDKVLGMNPRASRQVYLAIGSGKLTSTPASSYIVPAHSLVACLICSVAYLMFLSRAEITLQGQCAENNADHEAIPFAAYTLFLPSIFSAVLSNQLSEVWKTSNITAGWMIDECMMGWLGLSLIFLSYMIATYINGPRLPLTPFILLTVCLLILRENEEFVIDRNFAQDEDFGDGQECVDNRDLEGDHDLEDDEEFHYDEEFEDHEVLEDDSGSEDDSEPRTCVSGDVNDGLSSGTDGSSIGFDDCDFEILVNVKQEKRHVMVYDDWEAVGMDET
jgi:hypothetical protein